MTTCKQGNDLPKLAAPAQRALAAAKIAPLHGIGPNPLAIVKASMKAQELALRK